MPIDHTVIDCKGEDQQACRLCLTWSLGDVHCFRLAALRHQKANIENAAAIAREKGLRSVDPDFIECPCPTKQRAQLKIYEYLMHAQNRGARGVIQRNAIDLQAQHERIDRYVFDAKLSTDRISDNLDGVFLDEPRHQEETGQCVHRKDGGENPYRSPILS